jgi:SHS family lactate transporter-like MFS transporter
LVSGFLQQGYAVGYLIAAVVNLTLVPNNPHTWRALYWVGTGLSVFAAIFRSLLPESRSFLEAKLEAKSRGDTGTSPTRAFLKEAKAMLKTNWKRAIWAGKPETILLFVYKRLAADQKETSLRASLQSA